MVANRFMSNKPVKLAVSTETAKLVTSPSSSRPMLSPQNQSTPSPLASMENMFKTHTNQQSMMTDGYPAASGMMPGGLAQHGRQQIPSSTAAYGRQIGMQGAPMMAQGEMLSPTQTELQQQMPGSSVLGHAGIPMPDMSEPPPYTQHQFGQQQQPDLQQQYYHHQQMQQRQQFPYQQQQYGQQGPNTYEQVCLYIRFVQF